METKDIILTLRTKNGLSQDELAKKIFNVPLLSTTVYYNYAVLNKRRVIRVN